MKANELRIGNTITYNDKAIDISEIGLREFFYLGDTHATSKTDRRCYAPIPLTEEWLLKFGFELCNNAKITKRYNHIVNPFIELVSKNDWMSNKLIVVQRGELLAKIQYVHQLQNLYFALTGTEL